MFAGGERGQDVATADLVADKMRRGRNDGGVRRLVRQPVHARKMEAADAARLMAAGAGDIVEAALEARDRTDVFKPDAALGGFLQRCLLYTSPSPRDS